jgi:hypothetical protein
MPASEPTGEIRLDAYYIVIHGRTLPHAAEVGEQISWDDDAIAYIRSRPERYPSSTSKETTMAKTIDPALTQQLRRESEQIKDDHYPAGATGRRPNRQKVYSVRLSADEEAEVQRVAADKHLPPSTLVRSWILERLDKERSA